MRSDWLDRMRLWKRRLQVRGNLHRNDTLGALHRAWGYVHASFVPGDYYEFGVYRGDSLIHSWFSQGFFRRRLAHASDLPFRRTGSVAAFLASAPTFHGFDTFDGMPANAEGDDALAEGTFRSSLDVVARRCGAMGLRPPALRLVPGLFSETASLVGTVPAAIVHVDCDLYASAVDALAAVAPCLRQGSVLLFDDYNLFQADDRRGERRAVREFLARSEMRLEPWFAYGLTSQAFLCHFGLSAASEA